MAFPSKVTALCQTPCTDDCFPAAPILREDHQASKLPASNLTDVLSMCKTHRGIYLTMRTNQAYSAMQCLRLGVSGPEGKNYCATHMSQAAIPPEEGRRVEFEFDPSHPKAPAYGMENIPGKVLRPLVKKVDEEEEEELPEQEIASKITEEYGCELLSNALGIYQLLGDRSSSSNRTPPVKQEHSNAALVMERERHRLIENASQSHTEIPQESELHREKCYNFDHPGPVPRMGSACPMCYGAVSCRPVGPSYT